MEESWQLVEPGKALAYYCHVAPCLLASSGMLEPWYLEMPLVQTLHLMYCFQSICLLARSPPLPKLSLIRCPGLERKEPHSVICIERKALLREPGKQDAIIGH